VVGPAVAPATSRTGVPVEQPLAFGFTMRDGLASHFVSYWDRADAFAAMGVEAPP
jgi:ketosteroid isomerase-like protein